VVGSNTTSYAWDFENRLTSVTLPAGGGTVSFKYDPFGRRIYKSSSNGTSINAYDGDNLVEETNSSGTAVARYSDGLNIDEPLAMLRGGATSFYHAAGLGSITSLSTTAGSIAQTYTFDSYGNQTGSSGSLTNSLRYTAREFDAETSLYYYRARYYDTNSGRFISEDPIAFQAGSNFYTYVRNKPTIFSDPTGLLNFDASCNCSNGFRRPDLELADQWAQAAASNIDDPNLRSCVLDKLKNGTAKCGKKGCGNGSGGKKVTLGWAPPFGNTIHLCKAAGNSDLWLACTMVHEAAHTCGHPFEGTPKLAEKQAFGGVCPQ
jgi:RHS repeat-associated protein